MDIVLEDMTHKAKLKLLTKILVGIEKECYGQESEQYTDFVLGAILDMLDEMDQDDSFGTEGWQHAFGVSS